MRRPLLIAVTAMVGGVSILAGSASAASDQASCKGILLSSLAGQPAQVATAVDFVNDAAKALGVPPGVFAHSFAAQLREQNVEACLEALGF